MCADAQAVQRERVCADARAVQKCKSAHKKPKGRMAFQLEIPHVSTYSEKMPRNFHYVETETLSLSDRFFFLFEKKTKHIKMLAWHKIQLCTCFSPNWFCTGYNFSMFDLLSGGPFDLMSRRIIAANNKALAERIAKEIEIIPLQRDDES